MIRAASYRWFYVIVHTCCFCTWKSFNKYFTTCVQFCGYFHPLRCFTILSPMANIDFSFFSAFDLSFLRSLVVIVFCGLQLLFNYLTIAMFLLTFFDESSSCLSFWFSFSLLQKYPEVFLFWLLCYRWFLCFVVVCN